MLTSATSLYTTSPTPSTAPSFIPSTPVCAGGRWANFLGRRPKEDQDQIMDLFFGQPINRSNTAGPPPPESLHFNIARYNIGGGADTSVDTHLKNLPGAFLAIPGYKSSSTGGYDWSADGAQRAILVGADRFEAFSNSPPPGAPSLDP